MLSFEPDAPSDRFRYDQTQRNLRCGARAMAARPVHAGGIGLRYGSPVDDGLEASL